MLMIFEWWQQVHGESLQRHGGTCECFAKENFFRLNLSKCEFVLFS